MQRGGSGEDLCAQASLAYLQEQTNPTQALDLYQEGKGNKFISLLRVKKRLFKVFMFQVG